MARGGGRAPVLSHPLPKTYWSMKRYTTRDLGGKEVRVDTYVLEAVKETPKWVKGQLFYYKGSAHELGLWNEDDDPDCGVWIDPTNTITILEPQAWESPYLQFKILSE